VYRIILRHLSRAEGGLKALLNLRETCSTTKGWVDDLQEMEASRLFSQGQAYLTMEEEGDINNVALFLNTPPPHYIKSLRLVMSNRLPKDESNQRDGDSWNQFIDFWKPHSNRRLECLQICQQPSDSVTKSRLTKFMEETQVKSIRFINYGYFSEFHSQANVLSQLEELLLDEQIICPVSDLMESLVSLNVPLKKLQVPLHGNNMREFGSVRKLIEFRRKDLDFELTVLLPRLPLIINSYFFDQAV